MDATTILINFAYLLTFLALSIKEVLWLRIVLTSSHSMIFINNYFFDQSYNVAFWNFVFVTVNVVQIISIYYDRKPRNIPDKFKDLYQDIFNEFSSKEFLYFLELGELVESVDEKIICSGYRQEELFLVLDGLAKVQREGRDIAILERGQFIAEISFLTNQPASADVYSEGVLNYMKWDQSKIKAIKNTNNLFWIKLSNVLTNDITLKISK